MKIQYTVEIMVEGKSEEDCDNKLHEALKASKKASQIDDADIIDSSIEEDEEPVEE